MRRTGRALGALLGVAALATAGVATASGSQATDAASGAARGRISVFARVPTPGEPSLSLVTPARKVYVGTFEDAAGSDTNPSKVFEYNDRGTLRRTFVVHGQTPGKAHGVQVAERDRSGRLYLLDQAPARVVVLNPRTGRQHVWAHFADVPTCTAAHRTTNCSNTADDAAPEPDYAAWLPDGSMLVTDYAQQLVWRVPPGGGRAKVWLNSARLDGEVFGPAGIVVMPGGHSLLMTAATGGVTTVSPTGGSADGRLYRLTIGHHDRPGKLTSLWSSGSGQAPDGFAVSRNRRHVYIALAGPSGNEVVEVAHRDHRWQQVWHVPAQPSGVGTSPVVWDTPTSVQFLGKRILVTNQAFFTDDSSHWVVFAVGVGERGMHLALPKRAGR